MLLMTITNTYDDLFHKVIHTKWIVKQLQIKHQKDQHFQSEGYGLQHKKSYLIDNLKELYINDWRDDNKILRPRRSYNTIYMNVILIVD